MATENPVLSVLATSGNQAPLAAGNRVEDLKNGQIGIFDYHTGKSVDGTDLTQCQDITIVVGIAAAGGTANMDDLRQSAGQVIQASRNSKAFTVKGYTAEIPKIVEISGFKAQCETDYAIKIEFRSPQIYLENGYNQFTKTFNFRTGCCTQEDCTTCPQGDCNELAVGLVNAINADVDKLVIATLFANVISATVNHVASADGNLTVTVGTTAYTVAITSGDSVTVVATKIVAAINTATDSPYTATNAAGVMTIVPKSSKSNNTATFVLTSAGGTAVTVNAISTGNSDISNIDNFKAANPGACASIRLTGAVLTRKVSNSPINIKYAGQGLDMIVALIEGFTCNGKSTIIREATALDGSGYDLKQDEYFSLGYSTNGLYRQNAVTGLANEIGYLIDPTQNYNVIQLEYDQFSVGGWLEYLNNLRTTIAIPCADSTTLTGLVTMLTRIFPKFGAMNNDVASMDCTNVTVDVINDTAADGIEILS